MKTNFIKTAVAAGLTGALMTAAMLPALAAPKVQTGPQAEVTYDGLHRIDDSVMALAWAKPDLDLKGYRKIMLLPAGMTFKAVRDPALARNAHDFPLTERQKQALKETIQQEFIAELGRSKRFELTDQPGPDVLQIRGAILDVVSHVPPEPIGRGGYVVKSLGEATLVVELRDSLSEEILARAVERHAAASTFPRRANSVSTLGDVRSAARRWASQLRGGLETLTG